MNMNLEINTTIEIMDFYCSKDPLSLRSMASNYLESCILQGFSKTTLVTKQFTLKYFILFCESQKVLQTRDVDRELVESYALYLRTKKSRFGKAMAEETIISYLKNVRGFYRWSIRNGKLLVNPAASLNLPAQIDHLPKDVLTSAEVRRIMAIPKIHLNRGLKNRAIMETFYSTGIRRSELTRLTLSDFMPKQKTLRIAEGKMGKTRLVPIGADAITWINRYLRKARPALRQKRSNLLFLNQLGEQLHPPTLSLIIRHYIEAAGVKKRGSCHLFRHTMATLMLKNGADLRSVQEILGHSQINTTERYTHLDINHLIAVHQSTHPAESMI